MALDDYGSLISSARNAAPDYATMEAQAQLRAIQGGQLKMQMEKAAQQLAGDRAYQTDMTAYLADPTPQGAARLIALHPDRAEPIKNSFDMMDKAKKTADVLGISEMYSAAKNGRFGLAAELAQRRLDADKAAGDEDTAMDEHILSGLRSENPAEQKAALGMLEYSLQAITDGKLGGKEKGGYTLDAGAVRYDENNQPIAQSPYIKTADGGILIAEGGGQASGQGGPAPTTPARTDLPAPQTAVASVLSAAGLPAVVVSGALGNFEVEGGYGGAKGDGGTAHGLAQWRGERATNFQRVIGKPVGEANHEEQARFFLHEMQNPEEAGMTVAQRDRIMAARSPQEAATLIDKFYERSNGKHRDRRVEAAVRYHGGGASGGAAPAGGPAAPPGYRWLTPPKGREAPSGMRWTADGSGLEKIPVSGEAKPSRMTPAEVKAEGLDPEMVYYRDANGVPQAVSGQTKPSAQGLPRVPASTMTAYIGNNKSIRSINETLTGIKKYPGALGGWNKVTPDFVAQRIDPKGVEIRAGVADVGSLIIHDRSGAAVTISETPRLLPFVPQKSDTPAAAQKKLLRLRQELVSMNADMADAYSNEDGDSQLLRIGRNRGGAAGGAVKVRSIQEAKKLPTGTLFVTPDGRTMKKR